MLPEATAISTAILQHGLTPESRSHFWWRKQLGRPDILSSPLSKMERERQRPFTLLSALHFMASALIQRRLLDMRMGRVTKIPHQIFHGGHMLRTRLINDDMGALLLAPGMGKLSLPKKVFGSFARRFRQVYGTQAMLQRSLELTRQLLGALPRGNATGNL